MLTGQLHSCIHMHMHACRRNYTWLTSMWIQTEGDIEIHTNWWIRTHSYSNTDFLGRAPLWFWLSVKGKQHELLWPKKCIPDHSHMRLALHLYHVSVLPLWGLEKFRSGWKDKQEKTSSEQQESGAEWRIDQFLLWSWLLLFLFSFFSSKSLQSKQLHMCSIKESCFKGLTSTDTTGERRRKMKTSFLDEATGRSFHHLHVRSTFEWTSGLLQELRPDGFRKLALCLRI